MLKKIVKVQMAALFALFLIGSPAQAQCTCGQCYNAYYSDYGYDYQQMMNAYSNALGYYSQYNQVYNQYSPGYNTGSSYYDGGNTSTYWSSDYTGSSVSGDSSGYYIMMDGASYSSF